MRERALLNEALHFEEERQFGRLIDAQEVTAPIVILGLPCSGTAHLHYLLGQNPRLAYPTVAEVNNPHTFLIRSKKGRGWRARLMRGLNLLLSVRAYGLTRPLPLASNVSTDFFPEEDEPALLMSGLSPTLAYLFPHEADSIVARSRELRQAWESQWIRFLKKLTFCRGGRPLVLSGPHHLERLEWILGILPQTRFVFLSRDPRAFVPASARQRQVRSYQSSFQTPVPDNHDLWKAFDRAAFQSFLSQKNLLPSGQFHQLRYEDLLLQPEVELEKLHHDLGLPGWSETLPGLREALKNPRTLEGEDFRTGQEGLPDLKDWQSYRELFGYR